MTPANYTFVGMITPHFSFEELIHSDTAERLGIDNQPPPQVAGHLRVLAEGMEQVRAVTGHPIHVNSAYRCEALERLLTQRAFASWCRKRGKLPDEASWAEYFAKKAHPQGLGCDFTCRAYGTPREIVRAIIAAGIQFDQLILEGSWVHISFVRDAEGNMRNQVLRATFTAAGATYTEGLE